MRSEAITRDVLALYDGTREPAPDRTRIHRYLELPLNHLGMRVTYWDIATGLPEDRLVGRARGIVTWFSEPLPSVRAYLDWAARVAAEETRFVVLDEPSGKSDGSEIDSVDQLMRHLGLEMRPRWVGSAEAGSIVEHDAAVVDFEHRLVDPLPGYLVVEPAGPVARAASFKAHLTLESLRVPTVPQVRSSVVVTGPGGGYASTGYVRHLDETSGRIKWVINPFRFLAAALDLERFPVPDTTTVAGRRLYFSQIDGDGWALASGRRGKHELAADAVLADLIDPFRDLPVSVGLIASDATPGRPSAAGIAESARRMFAMPQVEVASHTHSHPYVWGFFRGYERARELALIHTNRARAVPIEQRSIGTLAKLGRHQYSALTQRAYLAAGAYLPRADMTGAFDLDKETAGALRVSESLAPEGKKAALYLWSGDSLPFEAAVKAVRAAGARNLNGGGGRLDTQFPSLMYLSPTARPAGGERQIYAVNADDRSYTYAWRGPLDGQLAVRETWERTEAPLRLKPINLHYHMLSGTRPETLQALRSLLDRVRGEQIAPVAASDYAAIADGFFDAEIVRLGPQRWRISKRGALQTVRLDDAPALHPDFRMSSGVLGYRHEGRTLYVSLDSAFPDAVVALTTTRPERHEDERPYLVESRWSISKLRTWRCGFEAEARGYGPGEMTWRGLSPGDHMIAAVRPGDPVEVLRTASAGTDGEMKAVIGADAISGLKLRVACARQSQARKR